jgi:hypothetical protein
VTRAFSSSLVYWNVSSVVTMSGIFCHAL